MTKLEVSKLCSRYRDICNRRRDLLLVMVADFDNIGAAATKEEVDAVMRYDEEIMDIIRQWEGCVSEDRNGR